ncbi:MAG: Hint domain-containing protein [Maritimibacter sp.]
MRPEIAASFATEHGFGSPKVWDKPETDQVCHNFALNLTKTRRICCSKQNNTRAQDKIVIMAGYTDPILLSGDMIATLTGSPYNQGNPGDPNFGMVLPGVQALGSSGDLYRLVWFQNLNSSAATFANGQYWRLESYSPDADPDGDPTTSNDGWSAVDGMNYLTPKNDLVAGLGAGDEYIVFSAGGTNLLYNINGGLPATPTTLTYSGVNEQGDPTVGNNNGEMDFSDSYQAAQGVVCFAAGTLIDTPTGPRPVEDLAPGDLVITRRNGAVPVLWRSVRALSGANLAAQPKLRPVRIKAGALGPNRPSRDLIVSPQHRMLVSSDIARRLVGSDEVLIPAIRLTRLPGITQVRAERGVKYHHFLCAQHEVVFAAGVPAETFYPGKQALKTISKAARDELFALFPDLAQYIPGLTVRPAHPIVAGRIARDILAKHRRHNTALLAAA